MTTPRQADTWKPKTERGKRLKTLRAKIVASGTKLLNLDEINAEVGTAPRQAKKAKAWRGLSYGENPNLMATQFCHPLKANCWVFLDGVPMPVDRLRDRIADLSIKLYQAMLAYETNGNVRDADRSTKINIILNKAIVAYLKRHPGKKGRK